MRLIKTKNFEVSVYAKGSTSASKIALVLPGRLDTKDYFHTTSLVDMLAEKGYYSLAFDPPGIWESPGSIDIYTTTNYLKAVEELIEYYNKRPTLLLGFSRGGSVAMLSSSNSAVEGIVCINANYGAPTAPLENTEKLGYEDVLQDMPPGTTRDGKKKEFKLPLNYFIDGAKYNPGEELKTSTKPKLLIYATQDKYTPVNEVINLYSVISQPKSIHEIDSSHNYRTQPRIVTEVNYVISDFIDKNLK